jgi:hypothetical protein
MDNVDIDMIIEMSGQKYTEATKEFLNDTIDVCSILLPALEDFGNSKYRLKDFFIYQVCSNEIKKNKVPVI